MASSVLPEAVRGGHAAGSEEKGDKDIRETTMLKIWAP